jgi:hypothetical protein
VASHTARGIGDNLSEGNEMTIDGVTVHTERVCVPPCPFHAPSDHPLKDAPMRIRLAKEGLVERICEHGVGHDDPDSVAYMQAQGHTWAGIHGCDGCCETVSPSRNDILDDFVLYCLHHPDERFWQALRNWSGYPFVIVSDKLPEDGQIDTFYWRGKNK